MASFLRSHWNYYKASLRPQSSSARSQSLWQDKELLQLQHSGLEPVESIESTPFSFQVEKLRLREGTGLPKVTSNKEQPELTQDISPTSSLGSSLGTFGQNHGIKSLEVTSAVQFSWFKAGQTNVLCKMLE